MKILLHKFGRFLQLAGMFLLPYAMVGNVMEKLDLKQMLVLCAVGMSIFVVGWLLQQAGGPAP